MKTSLIVLAFCVKLSAADLSEDDYNRQYAAVCESVEAKFPDSADAASAFSFLLDFRVRQAEARKDPALKDPTFIMAFAEAVAKDMREIGWVVRAAAEKNDEPGRQPSISDASPAPEDGYVRLRPVEASEVLERAEQEAARNGDVQAYLRQAAKGQAGVDPKLQTRARSGDLVAQAEMERRLSNANSQARKAAGEITEAEAIASRAAAAQAKNQAIQEMQMEELIKQQERIAKEAERLRIELERRRYQRR